MKRWMNNLSTRTKLILSFGFVMILLAAANITAYVGLTNIATSEVQLRDVQTYEAVQLQSLRAGLNYNMWKLHEMFLATDLSEQESINRDIVTRSQEIDAIVESLKILDPDPVFQSHLQELMKALDYNRQIREQITTLVLAGKVDEGLQLSHQGEADSYYETVRVMAVQMGKEASVRIDNQLAADQQAAQTSILLFVIIGGVALLFVIGLVITLTQTIADPLNTISQLAEKIGGGDLTVNLSEEVRRDEIGRLTGAFRQMVETLRGSTGDISQAVDLLGSSASEIMASTTQVSSGTAETAVAINETTATVAEVRQAAELSSQKAQYVSDNALRVAQVTQAGQDAVTKTAMGMDRIREQMETIAQTVIRLSEQSQSIGGIIASVTDLADQSNLLAVNAAIEAAKAGEQGRGFAVVAQEIKSLAEQSKQATAQVRGILSEVQKATSNAVMATEQGSKAVEAGVRQASQAGEAIRLLTASSDEAVQAAIQIVASSQQQVVGMHQIGVAMVNINQAGAQTAISMKQMEVSAQDLDQLGQKFRVLVNQFQT